MDQITIENVTGTIQQLPATNDEFGGVVVEMKEHMDPNVFRTLLKTSMALWKLQGKKGIWIKLPIDLSNLVDTAVKEGFWYHHAEPKYLMLLYWIPETVNPIPANASHIARVGAIVLNDKREMLVVQEKMGKLRGIWKISTGIIHQGEDICVGVVREVKEETGIETEFVQVLAFSQEHNVFFGKSEILFLCMMRPLSFDIQVQETEIEAAQWMPIQEYAAQLSPEEEGLRNYITQLCIANLQNTYSGFSPFPVTSDSNAFPCVILCVIYVAAFLLYLKNFIKREMWWSCVPFFSALCVMWSGVITISSACEYPCQPTPPSSLPLYGTPPPPPPPPEPVYEPPTPPSCPPPPPPPPQPVYEAPPSCPPPPPPPPQPVYEAPPSCPPPPPPPQLVYEAPPSCPPPPSFPSGPLYGATPPPSPPGNCQPSMQNCGYPPPSNTDVYQHINSASHLPLTYLLLILLFLSSVI